MTKTKTTRRYLANNFDCRAVGYCDLYYLLNYSGHKYYTCGVYGWNFDAVTHGNKCITTGYRGMIGERVPSEIVEKYEGAARKLAEDWNIDYPTKKAKIDELLENFFMEAFA